jgi:hypothetical protein
MSENLPIPINSEKPELSKLAQQFPVMDPACMKEVQEILESNLGPHGLTEQDLERIKVPGSGGSAWAVQGIEGEEMMKEVSGPIPAWRDARLYYAVPYAERGKKAGPPDCSSKDGLVGIGNPGGSCAVCPLAQFGSDPKGGRGQACKQVRQILLLRPDHILPEIVNIPPTSLKNATQYFRRLASRRIPYWGLITHLKLERTSNADGVDYARVVFTAGEQFSPAERESFAAFHKQMVQVLHNIVVDAGDYEGPSGDDDDPRDFTPPAGEFRQPVDD